jgi:hypothetical protein
MKLGSLIQICLNKAYNIVRVSKHLSDTFSLQNGVEQEEALAQFLLNFASEYAIRNVQETTWN